MSKTVKVSDETYSLLKSRAQRYELDSVERLLDEIAQDELENRGRVVDRIMEFQKRMGEKYGLMPDSAELIREDRVR